MFPRRMADFFGSSYSCRRKRSHRMKGHAKLHAPRRRNLTHEQLEDRRVLAIWLPDTPEALAEAAAMGQLVRWQAAAEHGDLQKFESAEQAELQLEDWSVSAFEELFGEKARTDFSWLSRPWSNENQATPVFDTELLGQPSRPRALGGKIVASPDGSVLYALEGVNLYVMSASGDQRELIQEISLGTKGKHLFLQGDQLVVLSSGLVWGRLHQAMSPYDPSFNTHVDLFDVSDPRNVSKVAGVDVTGGLGEAQLEDGLLHLSVSDSLTLPLLSTVEDEGNGGLRYETKAEYLQRLSGSFLASVTPRIGYDGTETARTDLVDWDDFVHFGRWDLRSIAVASLDLENNLALVDSELVIQDSLGFEVIEYNTALIVSEASGYQSELTQLEFENRQWDVIASGNVNGRVLNETMIDERDGLVRVATVGEADRGSNLTILEANGAKFEVVGQLTDFADKQELFGAYFADDFVVLSTADSQQLGQASAGLHAVNLSDPAEPATLSSLVSQGVATQFVAVDSNHLLAIESVAGDNASWQSQVSLYNVSSLATAELASEIVGVWQVATWTGDVPTIPPIADRLDAEWLRGGRMYGFDAATGMLVVNHRADQIPASVLEVSTELNASIRLLGNLQGTFVSEVGTQGNVVYALQKDGVVIANSRDLGTQSVVEFRPARPAKQITPDRTDRVTVRERETVTIDVLSNDQLPAGARVVAVSDAEFGNVSFNAQGQVVYSNSKVPAGFTITEVFSYTVELESGEELTENVRVTVYPAPILVNVQLSGALVDQDGNEVDRVTVGEEVQLELSADALGDGDQGIYQVVFEVVFDPTVFEVAGESQALSGFDNGRVVEVSDSGFSAIGGFSSSLSPLGEGPQRIVSIPLRAISDGTSTISIGTSQADRRGHETLIYGVDVAIPASQVLGAQFAIESTVAAVAMPQDVNSDGSVSASDALRIVNYLNQKYSERNAAIDSKLDVNRDGIVAASDVLAIINMLNERSRGEGESSANPIEDFYFEDIEKEKAGLPLWEPGFLELASI